MRQLLMPAGRIPMRLVVLLACLVLVDISAASVCPYMNPTSSVADSSGAAEFDAAAFAAVDFAAVKADIKAMLTDSQAFWPADFGNYGGLMIRQAWHCAGTYRTSDGRGGCDGGRQRFNPELSWADNTNLDKAKALLEPIRRRHGPGLSWGDLIILTGDTALESMGAPVLGFCGGRADDADGAASLALGPSPEQAAVAPCTVNGTCGPPLGSTTVGLIYVNPEGPMAEPDPAASAAQVSDTFGRMGMNDSETVALIGGGHAFGKFHGACPTGAGPSPEEDPENPWPGTCGVGAVKGKGNNTFTSGFEGQWTVTPTQWGNQYFHNLLDYDWAVHTGPGGHNQWRPVNKTDADAAVPDIAMLTTDVALLHDPVYLQLVKEYASDQTKLDEMFAATWYKLVTRDMGPVARCLGEDVPPPQPFQNPLPPPPTSLPDYTQVSAAIRGAMAKQSHALAPDMVRGKPYYGAVFATLAWQCASTFRATDYLGGCNGARIRFSPEKDWPANADMDKALQVLEPVKAQFGDSLTYADLIVLAGSVAIEDASGRPLEFCPGRSDATDGNGSEFVAPRNYSDAVIAAVDTMKVMGLTRREHVALAARPRSLAQQKRLGYSGAWGNATAQLTNAYFQVLLTEQWEKRTAPNGQAEYVGGDGSVFMLPSDLALKWGPDYLVIAQEYASDAKAFEMDFAAAWTKMMNADRFAGPAGNLCIVATS